MLTRAIVFTVALMMLVPVACLAESTDDAPRMLVAYFSCTGNTEGVANRIAEQTGADIYVIAPEVPYTADDLDYRNSSSRSSKEHADRSARPAIGGDMANIDEYDVIFVGYPIWWGDMPRIMLTFLESYDFSGKTVIPFCTSGSSGIGATTDTISSLLPSADVTDGLSITSRQLDSAEELVSAWLEGLSPLAR